MGMFLAVLQLRSQKLALYNQIKKMGKKGIRLKYYKNRLKKAKIVRNKTKIIRNNIEKVGRMDESQILSSR